MRNSENKFMSRHGKNLLYILIPFIILIAGKIYMGSGLEVPVVAGDEFQYLGKARYIADAGEMPSYPAGGAPTNFGYSLLISPAFMLFDDPGAIYQTVLFLNALMSATLYIWLFLLLFKIFDLERKHAFWIAFITSLYPAFLLQSNMAWTDAITPAFFTLIILNFGYIAKKPTWLNISLFAVLSSYIFAIHVRGVPVPFLSSIFLIFMAKRKLIDVNFAVTAIIIMFFISIFSLSYGDKLSFLMHGKESSIVLLITNLIARIEIFTLAFAVLISVFIFREKTYYYLTYSLLGVLLSFLFYGDIVATTIGLLLFAVALGFLFLMNFLKKLNKKEGVKIFAVMLVFGILTYLIIPGKEYIDVVYSTFLVWLINASGKIFYLNVASFGFFGVGGYFALSYILGSSGLKWKSIIKDHKALTLLFLLLTAGGMFLVVTNINLTQISYRPDRFFYGRYVEVFAAPFFALGIAGLIKQKWIKNPYMMTFSVLFMIIFTGLPILTYGNVIEAEPAFRNFLSFFPMRSALGNINILLFGTAGFVAFLIIGLISLKTSYTGYTLTGLAFLAFSIPTYIFVITYHHDNRMDRDRVIDLINISGFSEGHYSIDQRFKRSYNQYRYQYSLNKAHADFVKPNDDTSSANIMISDINYKLDHNKNALYIAREHEGDECLWIKDPYDTTFNWSNLAPSFLNLELTDTTLIGLKQKGFFENEWINGHAKLNVPLKPTDSLTALYLKVENNHKRKQNLIIKINDQEVFDFNARPGIWEFSIEFEVNQTPPNFDIDFYSDLRRVKKKLVGMRIINAKIEGVPGPLEINGYEDIVKKDYDIFVKPNYKNIPDELNAGDTLDFPIHAWNFKENTDSSRMIKFRLKDFADKNIIYEDQGIEVVPQNVVDTTYKLVVPDMKGKYFMEFDYMKNGKWLDPKNRFVRSRVVNIK